MDRFSKYCKVISGYAFKAKDLMEEGDIPVVKIGNISNGGNVNISSNTQYVDRSFLSLDEKYHIKNKDILISLTGSHMNQPNSMVGRSCRSYNKDTYLLNQRAGKVIPFDNADKDYLYYLLSSEEMKYSIVIRAYGAANQVNISPSDIEGIKWNFPEYDIQCRIGKILSTYDDLIEKNNRKIEILQEMAEELYKEWFVRFRFPGYKTAKFIDGIPDGWEIRRLREYGNIETGKTPSTEKSEYYGTDIPFVKTPDMHNNMWTFETEEMLSEKGNNSQPKKLLPGNSIMVSCIGTGGIVSINAVPAHTNQQINSIILDDLNNLEWLFYTCVSLKETIISFGSTGATMTNLSKGKFENLKTLYPGNILVKEYHNRTNTIFTSIKNLMYQNKCLRQQRDLLLPRLMSGKLEVC